MQYNYLSITKKILKSLIVTIIFTNNSISQENKNSELELKRFSQGKTILKNTELTLKRYNNDTTYADYWNLALAHALMDDNPKLIISNLEKSKFKNPKKFYSTIEDYKMALDGDITQSSLYRSLGIQLLKIIEYDPKIISKNSVATNIKNDTIEYSQAALKLQKLIGTLYIKDQFFRSDPNFISDSSLHSSQKKMDQKNSIVLDSLFKEIGFPGKLIVGQKYAGLACLILVHADLEMQLKWFDLIEKEFLNDQIPLNIFQIFIDKNFWLKYSKQVFGTQLGIPQASEDVIEKIRNKYRL